MTTPLLSSETSAGHGGSVSALLHRANADSVAAEALVAVIEPMAADQLAEAGLAFHEGEDEFWTRIRALTDVARLARRSNGFGNNEPLEAAERELAGLDQLLAEHGKGSSLASDCALSIATDYCDAGFALGIATALRYAYGGR